MYERRTRALKTCFIFRNYKNVSDNVISLSKEFFMTLEINYECDIARDF